MIEFLRHNYVWFLNYKTNEPLTSTWKDFLSFCCLENLAYHLKLPSKWTNYYSHLILKFSCMRIYVNFTKILNIWEAYISPTITWRISCHFDDSKTLQMNLNFSTTCISLTKKIIQTNTILVKLVILPPKLFIYNLRTHKQKHWW